MLAATNPLLPSRYPSRSTPASAVPDADGCFTVTMDTEITKTLALPVYIRHAETEDGRDVGMLREFGSGADAVTKPRYGFTVEEVGVATESDPNAESDWVCSVLSYGGAFGAEPNAFGWTNNYKYKNLLVTKKVTHAPDADDLSKYAFVFRLTENGAPYSEFKEGAPVRWTLCSMDNLYRRLTRWITKSIPLPSRDPETPSRWTAFP